MPQPITKLKDLSARGGPRVLLERHKHAALLGTICSVWGDIDTLFSEIFNLITFSEPIPHLAHSRSSITSAIFDESFISHKSKIDVIKRVINLRYEKHILSEFDKTTNELRKRAKERNELIHCSWQICDRYPNDLIKIKDEKWIRFTPKDFEETLERSILIRNELQDFYIKLSHTKRNDV